MTTLQNHILEIQQGIKRGQSSNKAAIAQGIVLRLLQALSWPTYDIDIVIPKYEISNDYFDYALCTSSSKPAVFIEINEGILEVEQENRILANAHQATVPITIITNGKEWRFYLTSTQGHFQKILIYRLDLLESSVGEIVQYLGRFLAYDAVCSGAAYENALHDYASKENQISMWLPVVWSQLVERQNETVVTLIADEVEKKSGYRPDKGAVLGYLAKLSTEKPDVSETFALGSGTSRMRKIIYWLLLIIPIILHLLINLNFWSHLPLCQFVNYASSDYLCPISTPNTNVNFLYYIELIWFAPVYWVLMNIAGLLQGPPGDIQNNHPSPAWHAPNVHLIVSYVSKGVNQDALFRAMRETQWHLDLKNVNYTIEVVTDIQIAQEKLILESKGPIQYYVVPENYQTKTHVKYKARALQYLLEQRTNRLSQQNEWNIKDIWVLHLDEESVLTQQAITGIENFINKHDLHRGDGAIGQGEILYNSYKYGKNLWITAADALRTGDDLGRFRFQYKVVHKPFSGVHGSFLLTPALIEQSLSWDSGARSQLTEDIYFALRAMEKKIRFDWVEGFIKEQSPFTWKDFMNQRARWYQGLAKVIADKELKLTTRMILGATVVSWSICWVGTFVAIMNVIASHLTNTVYLPNWAIISTSLFAGLVGSVYMIGAYRNVSYWTAPTWKKGAMLIITYVLFITLLLPLAEGLAVMYSITRLVMRMFSKRHQEFYIVAKD